MYSNDPPTHSIVEYFYPAETKGHRCGYCKSSDSNLSHGMWAHTLSPENYELLINRGWRRSGCYVYKPMNDKICCPMYTIRNLSTSVQVSRSQRKVLKRFQKFVVEGKVDKDNNKYAKNNSSDPQVDEMNEVDNKSSSGTRGAATTTAFNNTRDVTMVDVVDNPVSTNKNNTTTTASTNSIEPAREPTTAPPQTRKPHPLKKKYLRREKKRQKLIAKGLDPEEFFKRNERKRVSELGDFFTFDESTSAHKFTTKLVQVDGPEFQEEFAAEHALYQKYQMSTHGDSEHECRPSQFRRFLCDNPFGEPEGEWLFPRGTFHQHYYVDKKLMAVGVIDILPTCVSSVYFFYDPDYNFLSPGTLGALHEMSFVNELRKQDPSIEYYYLGFYIHSCVKMKYKSKFRPCQLVCPVTLTWVDFDHTLAALLDSVNGGFVRLNNNAESESQQDVHKVLVLYNRKVCDYASFEHKDRDREELESFVSLVSSRVASNMLLYRSS